jgi:hypothetical protein
VNAAHEGRTMFTIVWGCLSTTFVCAWVSVHPNIPPPKYEEYGWKSLARRLWLLFWTLVAPELILVWSYRQWMGAGEVARIYNDRNGEDYLSVELCRVVEFSARVRTSGVETFVLWSTG